MPQSSSAFSAAPVLELPAALTAAVAGLRVWRVAVPARWDGPLPEPLDARTRERAARLLSQRRRAQLIATHAIAAAERNGAAYLSRSHSGALGVVAFADVPVGIDVERLRERPALARVLARFGEDVPARATERELYLRWCVREAWAKAHGVGLPETRGATVSGVEIDVGAGFVCAASATSSDA